MKKNNISSADYSNDATKTTGVGLYQMEMETWGEHIKDAVNISNDDYEYLYAILDDWRNGIRTKRRFDIQRLHAIAAQFDGIDSTHPHHNEAKHFLINWYVCYMDILWSTACDAQEHSYLFSTKRQRIRLFFRELAAHSIALKMLRRIVHMFSKHRPRKEKTDS